MDTTKRIVIRTPLTEVWNDGGQVDAARVGFIGEAEVARLLNQAKNRLVVAEAGKPLRWVAAHERFEFWKTEVKLRLVDAEVRSFRPEDFPGCYCYVASEWKVRAGASVILLETHH